MAAPSAAVSLNSQKITNLDSPTASADAANKGYVDTSISNLIAGAPSTLDTLDEIAAALADTANFSDTVVLKTGSTMSGALAMGTNKITGLGDPTNAQDAATKNYIDTASIAPSNLTGPITSVGPATSVAAQTGTGSTFVMNTSPTLVTPILGTPTSGTLSACTVDGTDAVGFRNIPVNSQSAAYTAVLADSGKVIFHPSTDANARTFTIPANGSVAYPIGTAITFINMTSQVVTIAITTDTMYLSAAGTTGSRSLAQYGSATAIKMTSTTWLISGSGLT
jgi:hypothetical protein